MSFLTLRTARTTLSLPRAFSTSTNFRFPSNPTGTPNAQGDHAKLSRDKQSTGKLDDSVRGGSAQGAPTSGPSGGPEEKAGMPDPEVPKGEAQNAKKGMASEGEDSAARN